MNAKCQGEGVGNAIDIGLELHQTAAVWNELIKYTGQTVCDENGSEESELIYFLGFGPQVLDG